MTLNASRCYAVLYDLYGRPYNKTTYNCAHFLVDVYARLNLNINLNALDQLLLPPTERFAELPLRRHFKRLSVPDENCLVVFKDPYKQTHVGIFLDNKVLHNSERGVFAEPLETAKIGFSQTRFYKWLD